MNMTDAPFKLRVLKKLCTMRVEQVKNFVSTTLLKDQTRSPPIGWAKQSKEPPKIGPKAVGGRTFGRLFEVR